MHAGDDIRRVEESHGVRRHEHVETHHQRRRPRQRPGDGEPHHEVAGEALQRAGEEDDPGAAAGGGGGVEEAGEEADVGADVLEPGDGGERGLVVVLGGFEGLGVDAEGVE